MNQFADNLLESDLDEILGARPAPDLRDNALARLAARESGGAARPAPAAVDPAFKSATSTPAPRLARLRWLAQAAGIVLVLGLIGWLLTRPDTLPRGVRAAAGAEYRVRGDHIELNKGWILLADGAPVVVVGVGRVEDVHGRAVAGLGIPGGEALNLLAEELGLSAEETTMIADTRRWLTAGTLALCVLSGHVLFNGQTINAQDPPPPPPLEVPKPEDGKGVRAFFDNAVGCELRALTGGKWSGWLQLGDAASVSALAGAFQTGLHETSAKPAGWDHQHEIEFRLKDGRVIQAAVLITSAGSGGVCNLRLPGWQRYYQFDCADTIATQLQPWLAKARLLPRLPIADAKAMRALLARVTDLTFADDTDTAAPLSGVVRDDAELARLPDLLWPDDMGFSKTHIADRDVYDLTLKLNDGSAIGLRVGNTGIFEMTMAGETPVPGRILPQTSMRMLHDLFVRACGPRQGVFKVLRQWTGADSGIKKASSRLIADQSAWTALWAEHVKREASERVNIKAPDVDFENEIVLAVFAGETWNSRGYYVHDILQGAARYTLRVDEVTFQTEGPDGGGIKVTPYGIYVLPRTAATVVLEENVQSLLGKPPLWKTLEAAWKPMSDFVTPMVAYDIKPVSSGTGGASRTAFLTARNQREWAQLHIDAGIAVEKLTDIDWDKYIAVAATGTAVKGSGNFELEFVGRSDKSIVLRLAAPVVQTMGEPEVESIYRIWLLPRNTVDVLVETPVYGLIRDPIKWQETYSIKP